MSANSATWPNNTIPLIQTGEETHEERLPLYKCNQYRILAVISAALINRSLAILRGVLITERVFP